MTTPMTIGKNLTWHGGKRQHFFLAMALLGAPLCTALAQSGPSNLTVTPSSGSGASQTFSFKSYSPSYFPT